MIQKRTRRTNEEWMNLIQECRTSGLTDRQWCMEHNIQPSSFYYHIRRFREMACDIPKSAALSSHVDTHEVVEISFDDPVIYQPERKNTIHEQIFDAAVRIHVNDFQIDVSNNAAHETILATLSVLQRLC